MKNLAIITTHPIQYYAPAFKLLAKQCNLKVFYTLGSETENGLFDSGFNRTIKWDIDLLDGYQYEFLENTAKQLGTHHYNGIKNPQIIQNINTFNADALLVYGWAYHSHLKVLQYFKGKVPVWFRGDSHLLDAKPLWKNLARKVLLTWVYSHVDKLFYVGKANKAYFKEFGLKEEQLVFAPHAIDNARFSIDRKEEVNLLRKSLALNDDDILILFAGKFERKKNPKLLLQAFLNLRINNAHLLFVGNGELEEKLKAEKAHRYAQDDHYTTVHFMDFQNQSYMPVVYQACDLFCLPSQGPNETWGLAVNEAMAAGRAILVSDKVGCATDLIEPKKTGDIFQSANHSDFISKLSALVSNKTQLKQMGLQSKAKIKDWNFEQQINQILSALHAI
ncbi:glycosyltransferase family 4 protein [Pedobacter sp. Leaf170]|uniref:glycosyltransferase family 4 protein n=1 Tax=Pedobacter sp. Leaf170 TaxID=2876558 RepID=UPI001E654181|nr:glycosyltransferase family 4 protein [Pedobacter sp. Leaf170]